MYTSLVSVSCTCTSRDSQVVEWLKAPRCAPSPLPHSQPSCACGSLMTDHTKRCEPVRHRSYAFILEFSPQPGPSRLRVSLYRYTRLMCLVCCFPTRLRRCSPARAVNTQLDMVSGPPRLVVPVKQKPRICLDDCRDIEIIDARPKKLVSHDMITLTQLAEARRALSLSSCPSSSFLMSS